MPNSKRIMVTGGSGFIGGALIKKLLDQPNTLVFNIDKLTYSSDQIRNSKHEKYSSHNINLKIDLKNIKATKEAVQRANPDYIFHLAAETHVDRSLDSPSNFLESNIEGTYNLLEAAKEHWYKLPASKRKNFRFHHISTDEVFGSLGKNGKFNETSKYMPNSPYSASKAASDHLVRAWNKSFNLPTLVTNCSNNFGPYQFPEKLIPLTILKALRNQPITVYGDGKNIRDWIFIDDHVDALMAIYQKGKSGQTFCIGGNNERSNIDIVENICKLLDKFKFKTNFYQQFITFVEDRPGHDKRYSIDSKLINKKIGWEPKHKFEDALEKTVKWYLDNQAWCNYISKKGNYDGRRMGKVSKLNK